MLILETDTNQTRETYRKRAGMKEKMYTWVKVEIAPFALASVPHIHFASLALMIIGTLTFIRTHQWLDQKPVAWVSGPT
jgi:hypothetical protein